MTTLLINLQRRQDRFMRFRHNLRRGDFAYNVVRWKAVDGKGLGLNIAGLGAGYVGNYLSQLSALEYAFRYEGTDVLIFEDDAVLVGGFEFRFEAVVAELPFDWDCLYLGCVQKSIDEGDRVNERVTLVHSPLLRTAVLHRWESLPKIISLLHPIRESLDGTFCRLAKSELKVYATNPPLVGIHDPTDSDCAP